MSATLDVGGTVLVGKNATVSLVVSGGLVLENTTITAPAITIAPWSYLKLVNTTFNCGTLTIKELQDNSKLTLVSATSIVEGGAHDVILKDSVNSTLK